MFGVGVLPKEGCEAKAAGTLGASDPGNLLFRFVLRFVGAGLAWLLFVIAAGFLVGRGRLLKDPMLGSAGSIVVVWGVCEFVSFC